MINDPCRDCKNKEIDEWGYVCDFWCHKRSEYLSYMEGYKDAKEEVKNLSADKKEAI